MSACGKGEGEEESSCQISTGGFCHASDMATGVRNNERLDQAAERPVTGKLMPVIWIWSPPVSRSQGTAPRANLWPI